MIYFGTDDPYRIAGKFYALNASTGQEEWSFVPVGGVTTSPTIADGVIYFGTEPGRLYALH